MAAMKSSESFVSRWAVGSSAITMAGSLIEARAMATRCASPPESHSTFVSAPVPERPSRSSRRSPLPGGREPFARWVGRQHDVLQGADAADEVELLEDEAEGVAADLREEAVGQARDLPVLHENAPGGGFGHAADDGQQGRLPRAARAP